MPTITIITGEGIHRDPWHELRSTSIALAGVLSSIAECRVRTTSESLDLDSSDVVVVNASGEFTTSPGESAPVVDELLAHSLRGRPILAMHSSALAFSDDPRWADLMGGNWVAGVSTHPQIGRALIQVTESAATLGLSDFQVYDERYSRLQVRAESIPFAFHTEDGLVHPMAWSQPPGDQRGAVFYDGLGHGVESFDSRAHHQMLIRVATWLMTSGSMEAAP